MMNRRLLKALDSEKRSMAFIVAFKVIGNIQNIVMIFCVAWQLAAFLRGESIKLWVIGVCLGLIPLGAWCHRIEQRASFALSHRVRHDLRRRLFDHVYAMGLTFPDVVLPGELVQLAVEGIEQLDMYFGKFLPQLFYCLITPVLLFAVLAPLSLHAALALLALVPLIPLAMVGVGKLAKKVMSRYWTSFTDLSEVFLDDLRGMAVLKVYGADESRHRRLVAMGEQFRRRTMKVLSVQLNNITAMDLVAYGGTAVGILVSLSSLSIGRIGVFEALVFAMISAEFFLPLRILGSFFHVAMSGIAASERLFSILDAPLPSSGTERLETVSEVACHNLSFGYRQERKILDGVNLQFKRGEIVGLVGPSGCGKSTVAGLIAGFRQGYEGTIGYDHKTDPLREDLYRQVTLVDNLPIFFTGSVAYNLRFGAPEATEEELWRVLDAMELGDYFRQLQGLETLIGPSASNLSGGQKQRLAMARALLKDSSVYILDEATSNIDEESEEAIFRYITTLATSKAFLVITHRVKNTRFCHRIYTMQEGTIVEEGTYEELIKAEGLFARTESTQRRLEEWTVSV